MKIGIFGGAFNPVHNGHLHLMDSLVQANGIDRLIVIPTADPPHKTNENFVSAEDRFNMLSLALHNRDHFAGNITDKTEISDIEFRLKGKSYTYHTLTELKKMYPDDSFYLFMGSDQFLSFKKWYKYQEILKLAKVVGLVREDGEHEKMRKFLTENTDTLPPDRICIDIARPLVISSSDIREKIKNGESIAGLVPENVEKYIAEKRLYYV